MMNYFSEWQQYIFAHFGFLCQNKSLEVEIKQSILGSIPL